LLNKSGDIVKYLRCPNNFNPLNNQAKALQTKLLVSKWQYSLLKKRAKANHSINSTDDRNNEISSKIATLLDTFVCTSVIVCIYAQEKIHALKLIVKDLYDAIKLAIKLIWLYCSQQSPNANAHKELLSKGYNVNTPPAAPPRAFNLCYQFIHTVFEGTHYAHSTLTRS